MNIVLCPWVLWTKNTRPDVCSRRKMGKVERERSELTLRAIALHTKLLSIN